MKRLLTYLAVVAGILFTFVPQTSAESQVGDWSYHGVACFRTNQQTRAAGVSCVQATGHGYAVMINQQFVAVFKLGSANSKPIFVKNQP